MSEDHRRGFLDIITEPCYTLAPIADRDGGSIGPHTVDLLHGRGHSLACRASEWGREKIFPRGLRDVPEEHEPTRTELETLYDLANIAADLFATVEARDDIDAVVGLWRLLDTGAEALEVALHEEEEEAGEVETITTGNAPEDDDARTVSRAQLVALEFFLEKAQQASTEALERLGAIIQPEEVEHA